MMRADSAIPVVIAGSGACGLVAALAAHDAGQEALLLERDRVPAGSTALSSGFIPAAGTAAQRDQGIEDSPALFASDILAKNHGLGSAAEAHRVAAAVGPALDWLTSSHGIPFHVLDNFLYPGHSRHRMHAVPERSGAALMARLLAATEAAFVPILTEARATRVFAGPDGLVHGVRVQRPGGAEEDIACGALVLACNGYGGAPDLLRQHIPEIADAIYFGHPGNQGDALRWGQAFGAQTRDLSGYQGHGGVAHPHGALITWALIMQGAIQVNQAGLRFSNEQQGYSEQAVHVLRQPGGVAWTVFDQRLLELGRGFEDFRGAEAAGAVRPLPDLPGLPATLAAVQSLAASGGTDGFGRSFTAPPLTPPFYAVRVTGTLFHTQGGLVVDHEARVLRQDGTLLPNLFAGGGAACGVSGPDVSGYLSGNGLLTAVAYGRLAGQAAARLTLPAPEARPSTTTPPAR